MHVWEERGRGGKENIKWHLGQLWWMILTSTLKWRQRFGDMRPEPVERRWGDKVNGDQNRKVTRATCSLWSTSKHVLADADFSRQKKMCEEKCHCLWGIEALISKLKTVAPEKETGSHQSSLQKVVLCLRKVKKWKCQSLFVSPWTVAQPGSSVHGILQARTLEWVVIPFSRGSSWPRDWTRAACIAGRFFTIWATREALGGQPISRRGYSHDLRKRIKAVETVQIYSLLQEHVHFS